MFCTNCGNFLDNNAVACPRCGAPTGVSPMGTRPYATGFEDMVPPGAVTPQVPGGKKAYPAGAPSPTDRTNFTKPFNVPGLVGVIFDALTLLDLLIAFVVSRYTSQYPFMSAALVIPAFGFVLAAFISSCIGVGKRLRYRKGLTLAIVGDACSIALFAVSVLIFIFLLSIQFYMMIS